MDHLTNPAHPYLTHFKRRLQQLIHEIISSAEIAWHHLGAWLGLTMAPTDGEDFSRALSFA
ncbi:hypothetical protein EJ074_00985 [Mesorhizobium sp. M3A.F.Ca.ET.080.04.2.1]|uniref:hypothetical protein n=1 Tax=Mesorhizobium sp. M3A.F.Ca.ET.080.04.2.1 TaxID=2493676 RepID=UPI000F75EE59|nr:hypothetical protein [Mesorhizobium sp. M3A.F.Ca.ET.080.04.2.1]AZO07851.1 hypothetical protein EJ074_00985 [Mesorhizobium sp. M3A.F.Ca.ET.080.04.2.1]RWF20019.1 MAG: hypothetical protein EOS64_18410 [Mesorhizobium sp.]